MVSKWAAVGIVSLLVATVLLIVHYFTGKSWEPIVGALIAAQATTWTALWKELSRIRSDVQVIKDHMRR